MLEIRDVDEVVTDIVKEVVLGVGRLVVTELTKNDEVRVPVEPMVPKDILFVKVCKIIGEQSILSTHRDTAKS